MSNICEIRKVKMYFWRSILGIMLVLFTKDAKACKGCVSLDEYNFEKVISRFEAVLVKFDVAYPYGDKHDAFEKFAEEVAKTKDLIIGQVGVKDYGDKENEELAKRHGFSKDDFPAIRLFIKGKENTVKLTKDQEWSMDSLMNLIKDNTDIYVGLPGCIEKFDQLAMEFVHSGNKQKKLEEAEKVVRNLSENEQEAGTTYLKYMKKIIEEGANFITREMGRLNKILKEGKVTDKKKQELSVKANILRSFSLPKDEL